LPTSLTSTAIAALRSSREPLLIRKLGNLEYYLHGLRVGSDIDTETPIVPVMTRTEAITLEMTRLCREMGCLSSPWHSPPFP
jgi:hypothetical protein